MIEYCLLQEKIPHQILDLETGVRLPRINGLSHLIFMGGPMNVYEEDRYPFLRDDMVLLSTLVGKHRYSREKFQPYECGMTPTGDARERFSVKFYLVAMLFILFDVEAVFLYPWAVLLKELKMFGFWEMMVYIGIVLVGLFYVWGPPPR